MRLFLDANILFSAAYREGSTAALLFDLAAKGYCELVTSAFALEEARRNIAAKARDRSPVLNVLAEQVAITSEPNPKQVADAASCGLPDKDAPILAAAMLCQADVLVTGDRMHFGHLFGRAMDGVRVPRLADVYAELVG